jgi:hypothetical protein
LPQGLVSIQRLGGKRLSQVAQQLLECTNKLMHEEQADDGSAKERLPEK